MLEWTVRGIAPVRWVTNWEDRKLEIEPVANSVSIQFLAVKLNPG